VSALSRAAVRGHHINDWLDTDGRPLGEQAAPIQYAACRDEVTCPYSGSRRGQPMNRAALRQLQRHWRTIQQTIRDLSVPDATVHDAWRVSVAVTIAPLLLPRPTPARHAALYKSCIGFNQIFAFLLLGDASIADRPLGTLAGPDDFGTWLEREGWLHGDAQVCAGSMAQIGSLYDAFCGTESQPEARGWSAIPDWERATEQAMRWQAEALGALIADPTDPELSSSPAPWLAVATTRLQQEPSDVARLWPALSGTGRRGSG